jgi:hypothetical protein
MTGTATKFPADVLKAGIFVTHSTVQHSILHDVENDVDIFPFFLPNEKRMATLFSAYYKPSEYKGLRCSFFSTLSRDSFELKTSLKLTSRMFF